MADEAYHLAETLIFTANLVADSNAADKARICAAYDAGLQLIAEIGLPGEPPRPGIEACILRHRELKNANDIACAGWILAAIAARVDERDLPKWESFKKTIDTVVDVLSRYRASSIH